MDTQNILSILIQSYNEDIQKVELFRESVNHTYTVYGSEGKYFLKTIRHPFLETALDSAEIQVYLMQTEFPVIPIIFTKEGAPYIRVEEQETEYIFILYNFMDGGEPDPDCSDTEEVGELIGRLHHIMKNYNGRLLPRDKYFFIDRYVDIMRSIKYSKTEAFRELGNNLWEKVKNLPRGYCHCDLYDGNILKANNGRMYVVDFDTSCTAFPIYDIALFCNKTHYFEFDYNGYERTKVRLESFLTGYLRHCSLTAEEMSAFYDMLAIYHFQLQATILERFGYDADIVNFFDKQYDWLLRWNEQCEKMSKL